ncbi:MAG: hypothetical protein HZC03_02015, partial [Candidatus Lloydbacteria bacterium]|nr:hypothetical protein [Candidatus Lloydbacteria bacterium]
MMTRWLPWFKQNKSIRKENHPHQMSANDEIILDGKKYISSRRAGEITGYANDYIGELARAGKVNGRLIGRIRFVEESSLLSYKQTLEGVKKDVRKAEPFFEAPTPENVNQFEFVSRLPPLTKHNESVSRNGTIVDEVWGKITYANRESGQTQTETQSEEISLGSKFSNTFQKTRSLSLVSNALVPVVFGAALVVAGGFFISHTPPISLAQIAQTGYEKILSAKEVTTKKGEMVAASIHALAGKIHPMLAGDIIYRASFASENISEKQNPVPIAHASDSYSPSSGSRITLETNVLKFAKALPLFVSHITAAYTAGKDFLTEGTDTALTALASLKSPRAPAAL